MSIAIVIPCYNEEARFDSHSLVKFASSHTDIHFLLVNDGSIDGTLEVLRKCHEELPEKVDFLDLKENCGKAEATRQGLCKALNQGHDYVGFWDADFATPVTDIPTFYNLAKEREYSIVMGSRISRLGAEVERKWYRHYLGRIFATCTSLILGLQVYDTQCGAKIFHKDIGGVFNKPFISPWFFDVEIIKRAQSVITHPTQKIYEFPLSYWKDVGGSRLKLSDFLKTPWELIKIYLTYRKS